MMRTLISGYNTIVLFALTDIEDRKAEDAFSTAMSK